MLKRVLIVDGNAIAAMVLKENLCNAGCICSRANSGEMALEFVEQDDYHVLDLIVSAYIDLPGMNGLELLRHLRWNARFPLIPFILMSSQTTVSRDDQTSLESACSAFEAATFLIRSPLMHDFIIGALRTGRLELGHSP